MSRALGPKGRRADVRRSYYSPITRIVVCSREGGGPPLDPGDGRTWEGLADREREFYELALARFFITPTTTW
jgi:hypothetical protein